MKFLGKLRSEYSCIGGNEMNNCYSLMHV